MSQGTYTEQEKAESKARVDEFWRKFGGDITHAVTTDYYDTWAATYDKDLDILGYPRPAAASEHFAKHATALGLRKDAKIIDVAAGTGKAGEKLLNDHGFWNLEASDINSKMLDIARTKGIYKRFHVVSCEDLCLPERSYDAAVFVGYHNLEPVSNIAKLVKPGGLFVICINSHIRKLSQAPLDEMDAAGVWECLEDAKPSSGFYKDLDQTVLVYKIL